MSNVANPEELVERMKGVLDLIIEGYPRVDVSHEEFRVTVYKAALDALGEESELLNIFR